MPGFPSLKSWSVQCWPRGRRIGRSAAKTGSFTWSYAARKIGLLNGWMGWNNRYLITGRGPPLYFNKQTHVLQSDLFWGVVLFVTLSGVKSDLHLGKEKVTWKKLAVWPFQVVIFLWKLGDSHWHIETGPVATNGDPLFHRWWNGSVDFGEYDSMVIKVVLRTWEFGSRHLYICVSMGFDTTITEIVYSPLWNCHDTQMLHGTWIFVYIYNQVKQFM